ncbi:hypothetical protein ZIOFF_005020 [Zingiber officinale]|uniref:3-deoxy-8-phosphooctulonate synthase n=1 Tax=Zingiber officinale TaxID=94328 RepID=A0A8J5HVD2_ZINOF|nr:hypothetical protein ZIOFF_005020 [Zingiber officinale]
MVSAREGDVSNWHRARLVIADSLRLSAQAYLFVSRILAQTQKCETEVLTIVTDKLPICSCCDPAEVKSTRIPDLTLPSPISLPVPSSPEYLIAVAFWHSLANSSAQSPCLIATSPDRKNQSFRKLSFSGFRSSVQISSAESRNGISFCTIQAAQGPNVIESEEHILKMAKHIKAITLGLPLVFKSSFDKANRTSSKSFRGPGLEQGLKVMVNSAEKVRLAGNANVMVCERGTMFGYREIPIETLLVRDYVGVDHGMCGKEWGCWPDNSLAIAFKIKRQSLILFVTLDGGGVASGGLRELIPCIARTAAAVGVDGIFMEVHAICTCHLPISKVHDDPLSAPVDGPTQWPLRNLEELLQELMAIATVTKGKRAFKIDLTPYRD